MVVELKSEQRLWEFPEERFENDCRDVNIVEQSEIDRLAAVESILNFPNVFRIGRPSEITSDIFSKRKANLA